MFQTVVRYKASQKALWGQFSQSKFVITAHISLRGAVVLIHISITHMSKVEHIPMHDEQFLCDTFETWMEWMGQIVRTKRSCMCAQKTECRYSPHITCVTRQIALAVIEKIANGVVLSW